MAKGASKEPKFEEAIEQLESIIDQIEAGQIGLEESIQQYERGMKLVSRCQAILGKAQQRIAELTADAAGKLAIKGSASPDSAEGDDKDGDFDGELEDEPADNDE
jgi:exodeoxyribonuclease VII small subunit